MKEFLVRRNSQNKTLSTIEKDIEMLKSAAKQTNDVFEREISKTTYLHTLMEQKDRVKPGSSSAEIELKYQQLQGDLDDRTKEISDKNKEIWDKSKIIIEKNKTIDSLSSELRECRRLLEEAEQQTKQQGSYSDLLTLQTEEIEGLKLKLVNVQESAKEVLSTLNTEILEKNSKIE